MPNKLNNPPFPALQRVSQVNSYYCGPACLQMLLNYCQVAVDQNSIVSAARVENKIRSHGMTIADMGNYVKENHPSLQFWFKFYASVSDLSQLVNFHSVPVGVEWQGIFDYPDEEASEDEDDDPGHISVVTAIDTQKNYIFIADPDHHYAGKDRQFSVLQFLRRWWDINEVIDPVTNARREVDDYHGLFIVTPKEETYPEKLGLNKI